MIIIGASCIAASMIRCFTITTIIIGLMSVKLHNIMQTFVQYNLKTLSRIINPITDNVRKQNRDYLSALATKSNGCHPGDNHIGYK